MAKKKLEIVENKLYLLLVDLYKDKSFEPDQRMLRIITTEIEIRKRIPQSFKLEFGMYNRITRFIEIESADLKILIRPKSPGEEYREKRGFSTEPTSTIVPIDPETKFRTVTKQQEQIPVQFDYDSNEEIPF